MKFILNKCKVIQLGKYNLTPWRLGERRLESSNRERPEGQQITAGFAMCGGGKSGSCAQTATRPQCRVSGGQKIPELIPDSEKPGIFVFGAAQGQLGPSGLTGGVTEPQIPNVPPLRAHPRPQPHAWVGQWSWEHQDKHQPCAGEGLSPLEWRGLNPGLPSQTPGHSAGGSSWNVALPLSPPCSHHNNTSGLTCPGILRPAPPCLLSAPCPSPCEIGRAHV